MNTQDQIETKLSSLFKPTVLQVINESNQHNVPPNSETHFKVVIVSEGFMGSRNVARHQQVYAALAEQLQGPVHALALHTYTPQEWSQKNESAPASPDCLGGNKKEPL